MESMRYFKNFELLKVYLISPFNKETLEKIQIIKILKMMKDTHTNASGLKIGGYRTTIIR